MAAQMESVDPKKIFVGGISWDTDEVKLKSYFMKFGPVSTVEIKRDPEDRLDPTIKRHRGFGFVTFENPESVGSALCHPIHHLDNKKIETKPAEIRSSVPRLPQLGMSGGIGSDSGGSNGCERKIFLGGLHSETKEDDVKQYFIEYFSIVVDDVEFKYDKATRRMRGFGFVTLATVDEVDRVCQKKFHEINGKSVEFKKAQPRHATVSGQAILQMKHAQQGAAAPGYATYDYSQTYPQTNGQQFQQPYYGTNQQYYGYGTTAAQAAASYGQYGATGTNFGYDASTYRAQPSSTGDRQDTQSYYQQQPSNPYAGHGGAQQVGAYAQDTTSYTGRSAYPATQDSYGQQAGYGRASTTQQQTHYATNASYTHTPH